MSWQEGAPNPGSDEALDLGCRCPVLDNNHGRWAPWPPAGWWLSGDCPLHGTPGPNEPGPEPEPPADDAGDPRTKALAGLVVIPRRIPRVSGRRRAANGFTLHKDDCRYVARSRTVLPAPLRPYPDTISCIYCLPSRDGADRLPRSATTLKGAPRKYDDRHIYKYRTVVDEHAGESVVAECRVCSIVATGVTRGAAKARAWRMHRAADKAAEGAQ